MPATYKFHATCKLRALDEKLCIADHELWQYWPTINVHLFARVQVSYPVFL